MPTFRDQIEFKIAKLTRAIETVGDLPTKPSRVRFLAELTADRADLRRSIAIGESHVRRCEEASRRRSCGECGHPMTRVESNRWFAPQGTWCCETVVCPTDIVSPY